MAETTQSTGTGDTTTMLDARQQVLAALELPALDGLTEAQVRGAVCVWDAVPLDNATAVNLGPRTKKRLDGSFDWYPRGCCRCVAEKVWVWFFDHAHECPRCQKDPSCPLASEVNRIMREARR